MQRVPTAFDGKRHAEIEWLCIGAMLNDLARSPEVNKVILRAKCTNHLATCMTKTLEPRWTRGARGRRIPELRVKSAESIPELILHSKLCFLTLLSFSPCSPCSPWFNPPGTNRGT